MIRGYHKAMSTVTIPQKEYRELVEKKARYEQLREFFEEDVFSAPPTKKISEVIAAFRATGKYNKKFLESFGKGLKRSSYFHS